MSAKIKILTSVYILILAGIVFLADSHGTNYFTFVGKIPFGDKIGHFLLMGMFSLLLNLALNAKTVRLVSLNILAGNLIVFGLVTIEEFSQIFVAGRTFDVTDLISDYAGIFIFGEIARQIVSKNINRK